MLHTAERRGESFQARLNRALIILQVAIWPVQKILMIYFANNWSCSPPHPPILYSRSPFRLWTNCALDDSSPLRILWTHWETTVLSAECRAKVLSLRFGMIRMLLLPPGVMFHLSNSMFFPRPLETYFDVRHRAEQWSTFCTCYSTAWKVPIVWFCWRFFKYIFL